METLVIGNVKLCATGGSAFIDCQGKKVFKVSNINGSLSFISKCFPDIRFTYFALNYSNQLVQLKIVLLSIFFWNSSLQVVQNCSTFWTTSASSPCWIPANLKFWLSLRETKRNYTHFREKRFSL